MSIRLNKLVALLCSRFERLGDQADLDNAIEGQQQTVSLIPDDHPDMPMSLNDLGNLFQKRFQRFGDPVDLNKAVDHHQRAVSLATTDHPDMPLWLNDLGLSLQRRFQRLNNLADLNKAIEHQQDAVLLTPDDCPGMPMYLNNLGLSLQSRFQRLNNLADLYKAIEYQQQAVSLDTSDHPDMPMWLSNLGGSLHSRFERLGGIADLKNAIEHNQQAVSLLPTGHPDMPQLLNNLGVSLRSRFERLNNIADLDDAIKHQRRAVSLAPDDHPNMPMWLNNLGGSLHSRFEHLDNIVDLDKAIEHQQRAVSLAPDDHPNMPMWLNNLVISLHSRFERLDNLADLDNAIKHQQRAVSLALDDHPNMPMWLNNLVISLHSRFQRLDNIVDLDKAIEHQQQAAVSLAPDDHPHMPLWLNNLGGSLHSRFERLDKIADLDNAIKYQQQASVLCYQNAALSVTGHPHAKFQASLKWAAMCDKHHTGSSLDAYRRAMALLPQVIWIGGSIKDRYKNIIGIGDACAEAVSAAIAKEDYHLALEWLEEGRSIVWRQMMQLRTPFDEISAVDSSLAEELKQVASDLDRNGLPLPGEPATKSSDEQSLEEAARRHRRLAERWGQLIIKAQQTPRLTGFLRPKQASELMLSAHSGAVVLLNIHKNRCDALVIRPHGAEISCVPLRRFSKSKAISVSAQMSRLVRSRGLVNRGFKLESRAADASCEGMLAELWNDLVKPILDFLGYTRKTSGADMPHLTWCTTGPLSSLPIHAAGDYSSQDMIFDYVISSYTPTLSALLPPSGVPPAFSGILAVGQTSTPNMDPLPGTAAELDRIEERFQGLPSTQLEGSKATPDAVLAGMEETSWVHFACHANQALGDPTKSAFYLHAGMLELAAITRKQLKNADLAFLSACQTASGDKELSDEAVHLAAGMLTAGFRTVIATMWSIGDNDAQLIADKVYEHLLEGGTPDARRAAVAVHKATECLRSKVGVKQIVKWAPYIHIGL
ncbi:hypothetical protein BDV93DRAFT_446387 [Ceratobasidium sp. AG-I]|nr:hypothetical protein BDV93DRAFT_446387 [Ceratobasidium sp. AG-I]